MLWQWANNSTQVFILDLDGTLIPSAEIDNQCFWQAVFEQFDIHGSLPDLHDFKNVTDNGILGEWCRHELGRTVSDDEALQIKERFLQLLEQASNQQTVHFNPLAGVEKWLLAVQETPHVFAGIATGGWRHSARLKLEWSGLDRFKLPVASSDDAISRAEIMQLAAAKVYKLHGITEAVLTYVGDGVWDYQASQILQWGFVGIARGSQASHLKNAGAGHVQADFSRT